jgi:alanine dehydrogenase
MIIGVPKERKALEKRVAISPDGAYELTKRGHTVLIESRAGEGSFFSDEQYKAVGCRIVPELKDVWSGAELVVKVKEPHESEFEYFRPDLAIFDYLHLASMPDVTNAMLEGGITGIAYELVDSGGRLPLLEPMSEVAGKLSVLNGSYFLLSQNQGRGILLGGAVGVPPANVVIIGAGIAGRAAAQTAVGMGAQVTLLDIDYLKLERVQMQFGNRIKTLHSTRGAIERVLPYADLLIGAVLVPGAAAPKIITREMVKSMTEGSVIVDISIDQGGCVETIRPTSLDNPTYVEEGVIHYGVCNMPAQTPRTSTLALTSVTLPYIIDLAQSGSVLEAIKQKEILRKAVNTYKGFLTNRAVGLAVGAEYTPIENAIQER